MQLTKQLSKRKKIKLIYLIHKQKNYNFQIIDINGDDNLGNLDSDESIDSEEGFYEVHECHKYDLPKLVFYEEHVKEKEKEK